VNRSAPALIVSRLFAAALALSPALLAVGWLILPTPDGGSLEELADVEGSLARWTTAWLLLLGGALLALPASSALARLVPGPARTMVRVARLLSALGAMGFVGLAAVRGLHGAQLADDLGGPGLDPGLAASWDGLQSGLLRPFVYAPEILAAGLLLLGLGLAKGAESRRAGWAIGAGALVILGGLIVSQTFPAGIGAVVLLAGVLLLAPRVIHGQREP
jgi:hypothetical protein